MRINTNMAVLSAREYVSRNSRAASSSMAKLSTGYRITKASDDASGLSISNKMPAELKALNIASGNIEQASAMLEIAESAANSVHEMLVRMRELMIQAANTTAVPEHPAIMQEHGAIKEEIDRIAVSTAYRGVNLLDGTFSAQTFQVGPKSGPDNELSVTLASLTLTDLNLDYVVVDALEHIGRLDTALEITLGFLADIGAYQNRLEFAQTNVKTSIISLGATHSVIREADMAREAVTFSKHQTLLQTSNYMMAQANSSTSAGILSLFK